MSAANLLPCTHAQAWYCRKVLHNFSKHMHSAFENSHMTTMFILNCWVPLFVANVVHKLQILDAFHLSKGFYHGQCHALKKHVLCDWALGSLISLFSKWRSCVLVPSRVRTVACASTAVAVDLRQHRRRQLLRGNGRERQRDGQTGPDLGFRTSTDGRTDRTSTDRISVSRPRQTHARTHRQGN
jgi:hypothetical protein